jgi:hypothetical protein
MSNNFPESRNIEQILEDMENLQLKIDHINHSCFLTLVLGNQVIDKKIEETNEHDDAENSGENNNNNNNNLDSESIQDYCFTLRGT